ncbi:substrate-binding periplasmic protein [Bacterioplanoides sp.]|uniref:substrate-binding periplasmic protein n=1 Tax=Bacterioplanoides sp. TaxID=2066072 RepID=UPI003AFF73CE
MKPSLLIMSVWLLLITLTAYCDAPPSKAKQTLILATSEGPPYMIREPVGGLDIETVMSALEQQGYQVQVQFMSLHRAMAELQMKRVDVIVPSFAPNQEDLYTGDPHILYHPTLFSLKNNPVSLTSINDLKRYRLATFQGATGYFGPQFIAASQQAPDYYEHRDMSRLVDLLMNKRTDLVLLDRRIFHYFYQQSEFQTEFDEHHHIFSHVPAMPVFNNSDIRDDYNKGLNTIKSNGVYKAVIDKYGHKKFTPGR